MGETVVAARLPSAGSWVGCRADVFVDRPEQEDKLRDYERLTETSEAFIYVAMSCLMARRLVRS